MATKKDTTKKTEAKATAKVEKAAPKPKAPKHALPDPAADMPTEDFIKAAYLALLGREVDEGGLAHYKQAMNFHKMPRGDLFTHLRNSGEFKSKNA